MMLFQYVRLHGHAGVKNMSTGCTVQQSGCFVAVFSTRLKYTQVNMEYT